MEPSAEPKKLPEYGGAKLVLGEKLGCFDRLNFFLSKTKNKLAFHLGSLLPPNWGEATSTNLELRLLSSSDSAVRDLVPQDLGLVQP